MWREEQKGEENVIRWLLRKKRIEKITRKLNYEFTKKSTSSRTFFSSFSLLSCWLCARASERDERWELWGSEYKKFWIFILDEMRASFGMRYVLCFLIQKTASKSSPSSSSSRRLLLARWWDIFQFSHFNRLCTIRIECVFPPSSHPKPPQEVARAYSAASSCSMCVRTSLWAVNIFRWKSEQSEKNLSPFFILFYPLVPLINYTHSLGSFWLVSPFLRCSAATHFAHMLRNIM